MLFSVVSPHVLSIFEEALYSMDPVVIQRVFQLLQAHSKLCAAYQYTATEFPDSDAVSLSLDEFEGLSALCIKAKMGKADLVRSTLFVQDLRQTEDDTWLWLYDAADENEAMRRKRRRERSSLASNLLLSCKSFLLKRLIN